MLFLHLTNILPGRPLVIGPAPWFKVSGNCIRKGPNEDIVAEYSKNSWYAHGQYFVSVTCRDRACVHFEDTEYGPTRPIGPFDLFSIAGGLVRTDDQVFAKLLEDSLLWHCFRTSQFWPVMTIKPALPSRKRVGEGADSQEG